MKSSKKFFYACGGLTLIALAVIIPQNLSTLIPTIDNKAKANEITSNQNLSIDIALQDFSNLKEFNNNFLEYDTSGTATKIPDEAFLIVDTSTNKDNKTAHGWTISPSETEAEDQSVFDESTGKTTYTYKSDGATAGDIRKALADRNAGTK